jgi:hypothetical protein
MNLLKPKIKMDPSLFDEMKFRHETEFEYLKDENNAMREFFDKLAIPVIRKTVRKVATQLRRFPLTACQFGDDSNLNFFEEVCVMMQESSMDDYIFVEDTIERCCQWMDTGVMTKKKVDRFN